LEESELQLRAFDAQVGSYIGKDGAESSNPQTVMVWNCDVVGMSAKG